MTLRTVHPDQISGTLLLNRDLSALLKMVQDRKGLALRVQGRRILFAQILSANKSVPTIQTLITETVGIPVARNQVL